MIRKKNELKCENRGILYDGQGEVQACHLLNGEEELCGKGKLFAKLTLPVGGEIGPHVHQGEFETYYVLNGEGTFLDNGVHTPFAAGDVLYTPDRHEHALRNTGKEPLEVLAIILYV